MKISRAIDWRCFLALLLFVLGICFVGYCVYIGFTDNIFSSDYVAENLRYNIGGFLSGTIGIFLTFIATIFVVTTFNQQRKQFLLSQKVLRHSNFETTFFHLLSMLMSVRESINHNIQRYSDEQFLSVINDLFELMSKYYIDFKAEDRHSRFSEVMGDLDINSSITEKMMATSCISEFYASFMDKYQVNIDYFFRYIYNVVEFLYLEKNFDKDFNILQYLSILQSLLSDEELSLLFYHTLFLKGMSVREETHYWDLLDGLQFFENIDVRFLLDRSHHSLYPHTIFKFLNRDEIELKADSHKIF